MTMYKILQKLIRGLYAMGGGLDCSDKTTILFRYAGEPELLLLASILHMPIAVYVYAPHASMDSGPFRQIQVSRTPYII